MECWPVRVLAGGDVAVPVGSAEGECAEGLLVVFAAVCLASLARAAACAASPAPFLCERLAGRPEGERESCSGSRGREVCEAEEGRRLDLSAREGWVVGSASAKVLTIGVVVLEERAREGRASRSRSAEIGGGRRGEACLERGVSSAASSRLRALAAPLRAGVLDLPLVPFGRRDGSASILSSVSRLFLKSSVGRRELLAEDGPAPLAPFLIDAAEGGRWVELCRARAFWGRAPGIGLFLRTSRAKVPASGEEASLGELAAEFAVLILFS